MTNVAKPRPMVPASSCLPVTLIEELSCAGPAKALRKLHGKRLSQLQPLPQTLQAWALLQLDGPPRLCRAARMRLASAARNKRFREKVITLGAIHLTVQLARLTGLTPSFAWRRAESGSPERLQCARPSWGPTPALQALSNPGLFSQALLYYTNALNDSDSKLQQAACMALQQLGVSPLTSRVTGGHQW